MRVSERKGREGKRRKRQRKRDRKKKKEREGGREGRREEWRGREEEGIKEILDKKFLKLKNDLSLQI